MAATDFRFDFEALAFGPGDGVLLIAALVIDLAFSRWPVVRRIVPHPALLIAALVSGLSRRLNREQRGPGARLVRGMIAVTLVILAAVLAGWVLAAATLNIPFVWIISLFVVAALTVQRGPFDEASRVLAGFADGGPAGGREAAGPVIGPQVGEAAPEIIVRSLLRHLAGRFADGLVGGVFWYLLLGLPGLIVYRAINITGRMLDENKAENGLFGFAPTRLNDAVGFLPTWVAGIVLTVAAVFVPRANPFGVLPAMVQKAGQVDVHARGAAAPAFSGALGLDLSPTARNATMSPADIVHGQYLYAVGGLLVFGLSVIAVALTYAI
jgi:adenosylcobinamide-phosphate synthase